MSEYKLVNGNDLVSKVDAEETAIELGKATVELAIEVALQAKKTADELALKASQPITAAQMGNDSVTKRVLNLGTDIHQIHADVIPVKHLNKFENYQPNIVNESITVEDLLIWFNNRLKKLEN